jgi:hypothetical protein
MDTDVSEQHAASIIRPVSVWLAYVGMLQGKCYSDPLRGKGDEVHSRPI